jgi:hypothetical protein
MLRFQSPPSASQRVPVNEAPPGSPMGPLWRELPVSRAFFYMSLEFLNNSSPNKMIFHPSLEGPREEASPMFPKTEPLWKQTHISKALLGISFGVPSKRALPPGSPHRVPQKQTRRFQSSPLFIFQSPRYTSPFSASPVGPLWREMPVS